MDDFRTLDRLRRARENLDLRLSVIECFQWDGEDDGSADELRRMIDEISEDITRLETRTRSVMW
ncbi:hypothetical protein N181_28560 [Sinorhizobium fredii USDA 205]|uniref:Uncharacterized protein n=2 Tax=Rhizobium fredii TaxID=380 RepID=A0A2A6LN39_RHIFR|nr:hypothetical protein [Sinorhizobium fredii]AWM27116.1 hypothetical protein AOX55_00003892 [Sinorhizobium fredii CCBAU 25509]KSV81116.1 hypothetical protein N181_28560 [Sinorhizobium fredii USDA 205]MQW94346.1 hypothetical protein [Sinorhizobium fredii]MQX11387.1 hypothetical protein [Sinorhizobium fredii]PDT44004.1 hypothetical protein CO661_31625 [Sinorhizobium fredii]